MKSYCKNSTSNKVAITILKRLMIDLMSKVFNDTINTNTLFINNNSLKLAKN